MIRRSPYLDEILRLDPVADHKRIVHLHVCYEFPFDTTRSLEFALFRTFAVPSIAALLHSTGEFERRPQRRGYNMVEIIQSAPQPANAKLKEIYESGGGPSAARGKVAMIRQVQSLNPDALMAWSALGAEIMHGQSRVTRRQREMIATVVSATNHCSY